MSKSKILILMSGSIACYKICYLISLLRKNNFEVKVAASESALKFVGQASLEALSGNPVTSDLWQPGASMDHIYLERWADLIIAAPATAHLINRMASGIGDDLLSTLFIAHEFKKPFLVAPAMNTSMYLHPSTQSSLETLKKWKVQILEAASGVLACGETGYGKLLEPDLLMAEIQKALKIQFHQSQVVRPQHKIAKILVTAGGTQEPIDDVRSISNNSTGRTGEALARYFSELGFDVTLNLAKSAQVIPQDSYDLYRFDSALSLQQLIQKQLTEKQYDFIFHAAAVSDYTVDKAVGKIDSNQELQLVLKKTPKIVNEIKKWSPQSKLIAFKLTSKANASEVENKIQKLQSSSKADFVVQNDFHQLQDRKQHQFNIYDSTLKSEIAIGPDHLAQYFSNLIGDTK